MKRRKGLAAMTEDRRKAIASKGGQAKAKKLSTQKVVEAPKGPIESREVD